MKQYKTSEKVRKHNKKYYQEHKEYYKKRYQKNHEKFLLQRKKYRETHLDKVQYLNYTRQNWHFTRRKKIKFHFELSYEQFMTFWQKPCYYCGDEIKTIGLDRVDNSRGYDLNNIVSCCETCNRMKRHHSKEFFINHCKKIIKNL